jgi:hypothetical protein
VSEENEETLRREDAARERLREAVLRALIGVVFRGASVAHAMRPNASSPDSVNLMSLKTPSTTA